MAWVGRATFLPAFGLLVIALSVRPAAQQSPQSRADHRIQPERFVGLWQYNADESVNAATGRPERAQRVAGVRVPSPQPTTERQPGAPGDALAGATFGPGSERRLTATVAMIPENRSLVRDLLEIPEALTIAVTPAAVTFTDDLERARTYETNGVRTGYQIGAARFNAATEWNGAALEKYIDAANGFRMTETYFLSPDARRMFVILRVTSTRDDAPVMGVNRVYDRISE
jgi:hypothetical protein